jgi:pyruvate dehydrogenase (quinone)
LIYVARAARWRDWADPRFVLCVLNNRDLAEVSWEQRETEGEPRFAASQDPPDVPYAEWARVLGLDGTRVAAPEDVDGAWKRAPSADRPFVIDALVDPAIPLLPAGQPYEKIKRVYQRLAALAHLRRERADEGHDDPVARRGRRSAVSRPASPRSAGVIPPAGP